jgi:hypothetical protein
MTIHININQVQVTTGRPPVLPLMPCYNCRATMVAGTQCRSCGAWCR